VTLTGYFRERIGLGLLLCRGATDLGGKMPDETEWRLCPDLKEAVEDPDPERSLVDRP
jgi:hypothetical protein